MFAKRSKQSSRQQSPADDGGQTAPSGTDDHETTVDGLERELAEQRDAAKTLRESLDAVTFQKEILEKSYAKQLAEVREKLAALEAELQEKGQILANLGGGHEHTLRELTDALTVIKVLKKEREQLRKQVAQGGSFRPRTETTKARALLGDDAPALPPAPGDDSRGGTSTDSDDDTSGGTINAMIANAGWAEKKAGVGTGQATAQVGPEPDAPQVEMIAPDLVFTANDQEKDDER